MSIPVEVPRIGLRSLTTALVSRRLSKSEFRTQRALPITVTRSLKYLRLAGFILFASEFVALIVWSNTLYARFSLTSDFSGYSQAWYLIAHGHFDPTLTTWGGFRFITSHFEIMVWIFAPLWWIFRSGRGLLWIQDFAIVVTQIVAFTWILNLAMRSRLDDSETSATKHQGLSQQPHHLPPLILGSAGLILLLADPWFFWAASFDFHMETIGACFAMLCAYSLAHDHKRWWILAICTFACGDVSCTYLAGVGISAILAGKQWRSRGIATFVSGVGATGIITLIGANRGSGLSEYFSSSPTGTASTGIPIIGLVTHSLRTLFSHWLNIYANAFAAGGFGLVAAWGFGVPLVVFLENDLKGGFSITAFQNEAMFGFITVGTIMVILRMSQKWPRMATGFLALAVALTIGWGATFYPRAKDQWLRVSPTAASVLNKTLRQLPPNADVVVSEGIGGPFAERTAVTLTGGGGIPVRKGVVYFVIAPRQGIELTSVTSALGELNVIASSLHAQLVRSGGGVWVFRWNRPANVHRVRFPATCPTMPSWALSTNSGVPITKGPVNNWGIVTTYRRGYLVYGDYTRLAGGQYFASIALDSGGPLSIQIWDADRNELLAQRNIPGTLGPNIISAPFSTPQALPAPQSTGVGPFEVHPVPPPPNDQIEVRIWSPAHTYANVKSIQVIPSSLESRKVSVATRAAVGC